MDPVTLRQYETLSPFEIKNDLAKIATKTAHASQVAYLNAGRGNPNWIATEPRSAFFLLGQFAVTESQRTMDLPGGLGGMPKAPGVAARLAAWLAAHADMPGAAFLRDVIPWAVATVRLPGRRVRARTGRLDHRRQLPGPRSDAGPQREDRSRVPAVGDVRRAAPRRHLRAVCGRGRHGGHVLPVQVAQGQPAAQPGRHDCAGDADLHALPRDAAPGGLQPQDGLRAGASGEPLAVHGRGPEGAARSEGQGVLRRQSGQPLRGGPEQGVDREDRRHPRAPSRPAAPDRRRLRDLRRRLPIAPRGVSEEHDRRLLLQQVLRLHGLAPGRHRAARAQHLRREDCRARRDDPAGARQALHRPDPAAPAR